jgi:hypothetical protein
LPDLVPALRRHGVCAIPLLRIFAPHHFASLTRQNNEIERTATADNETNKHPHHYLTQSNFPRFGTTAPIQYKKWCTEEPDTQDNRDKPQ